MAPKLPLLIIASYLFSICCAAAVQPRNRQYSISPLEPSVKQSSTYELTENYVDLQTEDTTGSSGSGPSATVQSLYGSIYVVPIQFGNQTFKALVDTGATDTWIVQTGFTCVNATGKPQPEAKCRFPSTYNGTFQYGQIPNENFYAALGFSEFVQGIVGYEDITIAGLTVKKQEAALITRASYNGYGVGSGLLGLAYPYESMVFKGTNSSNDTPKNQASYPPVFTRMYKDGLIKENLFSLALNRGNSTNHGGYISFGGLPPVPFNQSDYAQTKIHIANIVGFSPGKTHYTLYTIIPSGTTLGGKTTKNTDYFFVDSGTPSLYLSSALAAEIGNAFIPPAKRMSTGQYAARCDAKPPKDFGVEIGGKNFMINPKDMLFPRLKLPGTNLCVTGVFDVGKGPYVLGDVFLANTVAVFDVGAAMMRFYPREKY